MHVMGIWAEGIFQLSKRKEKNALKRINSKKEFKGFSFLIAVILTFLTNIHFLNAVEKTRMLTRHADEGEPYSRPSRTYTKQCYQLRQPGPVIRWW